MGDEYPCPHCGAMNRERTDYLRITCRVCGGQYEARHLVSSTSIAELAKQVSPEDDAEMVAMMECPHQEAVFWNPYNHVVQCHRCGVIFGPWDYNTPLPESVAPHIDVNAKRPAPYPMAEVERLRAREAALVAQNAQAMAIVGRVAKAAVGEWNQCTLGCAPVWDGFTWRHAADCTVMKARALLEQK